MSPLEAGGGWREFEPRPVERPRNLREMVLLELRTAIITGELRAGEVVSAPVVGARMGVSATPVREAMVDLVSEGLVESVRNRGFRVTGMTEQDLDDLTEVRLLIEPPMMRSVVGCIGDDAFGELHQLADLCFSGAETGALTEYLEHDRRFHARILSFTGNPRIVDLATSLRRATRMYGLNALARAGVLTDSAQEHYQLLECLRAGDGEAAERLMRAHIGHARSIWATG